MVKEKLMEKNDWQQRTELLLGEEKMNRIRKAHVLVVGLGGVGAYAAEMLCRTGVGKMTIVDADTIDTISPKCFLIYEAMKRHIKIVSSMGAGAKSDISQVRFADLWDTYHCGLSKAVRKRLQKMGMKRKLPVVFSTEQADPKAVLLTDDEQNKKSTCGTVSYMPAVFGCYLAEYVIKRL